MEAALFAWANMVYVLCYGGFVQLSQVSYTFRCTIKWDLLAHLAAEVLIACYCKLPHCMEPIISYHCILYTVDSFFIAHCKMCHMQTQHTSSTHSYQIPPAHTTAQHPRHTLSTAGFIHDEVVVAQCQSVFSAITVNVCVHAENWCLFHHDHLASAPMHVPGPVACTVHGCY